MKRLIAIVLFLFFSLSFATPALAQTSVVPNHVVSIKNIEIQKAIVAFEITGTTAKCSMVAKAKSADISLRTKMSLQQKTENGWKTVASWSASGSGTKGVTLIKTKRWLASGSYRVCLTVSVYDGAGKLIETKTVYSAIKSV